MVLALALTAALAASALWASSARADGDPASDVLATQALYLPQDAGVPASRQAQIGALLQAAREHGYGIRVAVIASPADLGSITELWRQPRNYARFLGVELSLVYRGPLLVVMPAGYGVYGLAGPRAAERSALSATGAPGRDLAAATLTAVQALAAAAGHDLSLPSAAPPPRAASTDTVSWIVFALGAALIVIAWTASLRARPPRGRGGEPASR